MYCACGKPWKYHQIFPDIYFQYTSTERRVGRPQPCKLGTEQKREAEGGSEEAKKSDGMDKDSFWMDECAK